jgi:hypothetical protein
MNLLEHAQGRGEVYSQKDGRTLGLSTYDLRIMQETADMTALTGRHQRKILPRIEGEITDPVPPQAKNLYITLEDGRRFCFFVRDSLGTVVNTGGGTFP